MRHARGRKGFTLIEILVVVMIVGLLAAVAVPQYLKSIETSKADDAVALTNMIGTTNKMFALDHSGTYVTGTFPTTANTGCGSGTCSNCPTSGGACCLVFCKYMADQNFGSKAYTYTAANDATASSSVSSCLRNGGGSPYSGWGYTMNATGVITTVGSSPTPTY